jgi:LysM repeat protein
MVFLRQIGAGFLLAIISLSLVFGGFVFSVAEDGGKSMAALAPVPSQTMTQTSSLPATALLPGTPASDGTQIATMTATQEVTSTSTLPPTPSSCTPPVGWVAITVQTSDTINNLAQTYQTTASELMAGNCLFSDQLVPGTLLYVPPMATATSLPCGAPFGWITYRVVTGDTLYTIGLRFGGVSVLDLQKANCLGGSTYIYVGQQLKVPNVVPLPPFVTWTPIPTSVPPLPTDTPIAPSETPVPVETVTPVIVPTDTPIPTPVTPGYP